jgi:hypothetical protein
MMGMRAGWLVVVAACGFTHGAQPSDGMAPGGDARRDARIDAPADARIDARPDAFVMVPITLVQTAANQHGNANNSNVTVSLTTAQSAGDFTVVVASWYTPGATLQALSDTALDSFQLVVEISDGTITERVYYAANSKASAVNIIAAQWDMNVLNPELRVVSYRGIAATNPVDKTATNTGNGSTASVGPVSTTHAHELLFAADVAANTTNGPGTGYTQEVLYMGDLVEDREVPAMGSYGASAPLQSSEWVMALVTFVGAG